MTKTSLAVFATILALLGGALFTPLAEAASKPKFAAAGYFSPNDDGTAAVFEVRFYSKKSFKVKNWKQMDAIAKKYRPKNVVLHFKGKKIKMFQVAEVMPEFIYPFFATENIPGLDYTKEQSAKVTFKNKVKKKTQTFKIKLTPQEPVEEEPVGEEPVDCDPEFDDCDY